MANQNINVNVTVNAAFIKNNIPAQEQSPTAYYPITDGDYDSMQYYENNGYAVRHIMIHGKKCCFVLLPVSSQAEADRLNTAFETLHKQEELEYARRYGRETSYENLIDEGYDPASENCDLADIVSDTILTKALWSELHRLSDEKKRICKGIMNGESDYKVAKELHLAYTTYRDRKIKTLDELAKILKKLK